MRSPSRTRTITGCDPNAELNHQERRKGDGIGEASINASQAGAYAPSARTTCTRISAGSLGIMRTLIS